MFAVSGESKKKEIFEYNTTAVRFLQNLGKFTNSLKIFSKFPEFTNII